MERAIYEYASKMKRGVLYSVSYHLVEDATVPDHKE